MWKGEKMQVDFEKTKNLYQVLEIKITAFDGDVVKTSSSDPYVDDEYGNLFD